MENKLIANIPKISLKRLEGNNYTQSFELNDIKIKSEEIKTEDTSEEFVPPNEVKSKKGKKSGRLVVHVPTTVNSKVIMTRSTRQKSIGDSLQEPSTSQSPKKYRDKKHYDEEIMVQKIAQILINHNFHNKPGNADISNLVNKVRKIVQQGYTFKGEEADDLTSSIAKVLLEKEISMPALTGIINESINNSTSLQVEKNIESKVSDNRRKRKAAIEAEKHFDSIADDLIINLDDELDTTDTDFIPDGINKYERPPISKRKMSIEPKNKKTGYDDEQKRNITIIHDEESTTIDNTTPVEADKPRTRKVMPILRVKAGPKTFKNKMKRKFFEQSHDADRTTEEQMNSILLREDCESESLNNINVSETTSVIATSTAPFASLEDDEVLPLPLFLLTNNNFINIVAHTYLNGNPMLDTDAAKLAARYSTLKTFNEAKQTGKPITSGPIYDIAVKVRHEYKIYVRYIKYKFLHVIHVVINLFLQVLGKELFKRMDNNNSKPNTPSVEEANVTIELNEKMREMSEDKAKEGEKEKRSSNYFKSSTPSVEEANFMIELREQMQEMSEDKAKEVKKEKSKKRKIHPKTSTSDAVQMAPHERSTNRSTNGNVVPVGL